MSPSIKNRLNNSTFVCLEEKTMTLVAKIIALLAILLITIGATGSGSNISQFVYLNNPETLKTTGILHQKKYSQNTNVRYFFHYVNGTKVKQSFKIKSNYIVKNLKIAYDIHKRPEFAGSNSVMKFMNSKTDNSKVEHDISLNPKETISGIFEGLILQNDEVQFSFGSGNKLIAKDLYQEKFDFNVDLNVDIKNNAKFRLGNPIKDTVAGQYGSNINLLINPKDDGILKLSFSPRGGEGLLVFENRGKIYNTDIKSAYKNYEVILIPVEKGKQEKFTFIPIGGLNYPIELCFSLHTEILKEANTVI